MWTVFATKKGALPIAVERRKGHLVTVVSNVKNPEAFLRFSRSQIGCGGVVVAAQRVSLQGDVSSRVERLLEEHPKQVHGVRGWSDRFSAAVEDILEVTEEEESRRRKPRWKREAEQQSWREAAALGEEENAVEDFAVWWEDVFETEDSFVEEKSSGQKVPFDAAKADDGLDTLGMLAKRVDLGYHKEDIYRSRRKEKIRDRQELRNEVLREKAKTLFAQDGKPDMPAAANKPKRRKRQLKAGAHWSGKGGKLAAWDADDVLDGISAQDLDYDDPLYDEEEFEDEEHSQYPDTSQATGRERSPPRVEIMHSGKVRHSDRNLAQGGSPTRSSQRDAQTDERVQYWNAVLAGEAEAPTMPSQTTHKNVFFRPIGQDEDYGRHDHETEWDPDENAAEKVTYWSDARVQQEVDELGWSARFHSIFEEVLPPKWQPKPGLRPWRAALASYYNGLEEDESLLCALEEALADGGDSSEAATLPLSEDNNQKKTAVDEEDPDALFRARLRDRSSDGQEPNASSHETDEGVDWAAYLRGAHDLVDAALADAYNEASREIAAEGAHGAEKAKEPRDPVKKETWEMTDSEVLEEVQKKGLFSRVEESGYLELLENADAGLFDWRALLSAIEEGKPFEVALDFAVNQTFS